jgi:hypothetical protein
MEGSSIKQIQPFQSNKIESNIMIFTKNSFQKQVHLLYWPLQLNIIMILFFKLNTVFFFFSYSNTPMTLKRDSNGTDGKQIKIDVYLLFFFKTKFIHLFSKLKLI